MKTCEYKLLTGSPTGIRLMPWASQEVKDEIGLGSYERKLNKLAQEGWEVIESSTSAVGNFLYLRPVTTTLLRRDRELPEE